MHNMINHFPHSAKNIPALLQNPPFGPGNNSSWCLIRCNARRGKGSLHLPARIYLSPINVCGTATVWPFAALKTYSSVDASALLTLATTRHTPITLCLCSYWSAKHFNPSLSPRPWRQPKMINQRQVSSTQKQHLGYPVCIHYPQYSADVMLNIGCVRNSRKRSSSILVKLEPRNTSIMCYRSDAVRKAYGNTV